MNYRHIYHAGGLADLIKHIILAHLLKRLAEKPAAFCVLDTHAAIGLYDLESEAAKKTGEAAAGILPFSALPQHESLQPFQAVLEACNHGSLKPVRFYPGSPAIIRHYLRKDDRFLAIEKHPEDAAQLRALFAGDTRIHIHLRDGWEAMQALIPPREKRALAFIDPPYEKPDEMDEALTTIGKAYAKMPHALFALWYPLKDPIATGALHEHFANSIYKKVLRVDVPYACAGDARRMYGSGMILINPPFQLEAQLRSAFSALAPLFEPGTTPPILEWLKSA